MGNVPLPAGWPSAGAARSSVPSIFDAEERNISVQTGAARGEVGDIWLQSIPGREIAFRKKGVNVRVRIFVTDHRVYELVSSVPDSSPADETERFFATFAVQPPAVHQ
jgi:hypothetical protein